MKHMAFVISTGILIGIRTIAVYADQTEVSPPQGSALLLEVAADGVQI